MLYLAILQSNEKVFILGGKTVYVGVSWGICSMTIFAVVNILPPVINVYNIYMYVAIKPIGSEFGVKYISCIYQYCFYILLYIVYEYFIEI